MMSKHTSFDNTLTMLKDLIEHEAEEKMLQAGVDVAEVKKRVQLL